MSEVFKDVTTNGKWRAIDKIKGLKLGTTEAEHNKQEQETREEQIRAEERQKNTRKNCEMEAYDD
ncbi:hypothetical protein ABMB44_14160 [Levilactobacillus brevis]